MSFEIFVIDANQQLVTADSNVNASPAGYFRYCCEQFVCELNLYLAGFVADVEGDKHNDDNEEHSSLAPREIVGRFLHKIENHDFFKLTNASKQAGNNQELLTSITEKMSIPREDPRILEAFLEGLKHFSIPEVKAIHVRTKYSRFHIMLKLRDVPISVIPEDFFSDGNHAVMTKPSYYQGMPNKKFDHVEMLQHTNTKSGEILRDYNLSRRIENYVSKVCVLFDYHGYFEKPELCRMYEKYRTLLMDERITADALLIQLNNSLKPYHIIVRDEHGKTIKPTCSQYDELVRQRDSKIHDKTEQEKEAKEILKRSPAEHFTETVHKVVDVMNIEFQLAIADSSKGRSDEVVENDCFSDSDDVIHGSSGEVWKQSPDNTSDDSSDDSTQSLDLDMAENTVCENAEKALIANSVLCLLSGLSEHPYFSVKNFNIETNPNRSFYHEIYYLSHLPFDDKSIPNHLLKSIQHFDCPGVSDIIVLNHLSINQQFLMNCEFPHHAIPKKYLCAKTHLIIDTVMVDKRFPDLKYNRTTLEAHQEIYGTNPTYHHHRLEKKHFALDTTLSLEIKKFMRKIFVVSTSMNFGITLSRVELYQKLMDKICDPSIEPRDFLNYLEPYINNKTHAFNALSSEKKAESLRGYCMNIPATLFADKTERSQLLDKVFNEVLSDRTNGHNQPAPPAKKSFV